MHILFPRRLELRFGHGETIGLSIHGSRQDAMNVDVIRLQLVGKDFAGLANRPLGNGISSNACAASTQDSSARDGHDPAGVLTIMTGTMGRKQKIGGGGSGEHFVPGLVVVSKLLLAAKPPATATR